MLCPAAAADAKAAKVVQEPVYQLYPVLNENRWLWQFLHSLLMLLSFCFLLPLGSLLARHKWIFGRDELSVSAAYVDGVLQDSRVTVHSAGFDTVQGLIQCEG
jgi:hypothetical protein